MRLIKVIWSASLFLSFLSIPIFSQGVPAGAMADAPQSTDPPPAVEDTPVTPTSTATIAKHAGPPMILIARPVYAPYSEEQKTMYISAVTEGYYRLKLSSLSGFEIISQEKLANNIQYFRDFSRRISRSAYLDAAQRLGATYLIYQEYEPSGKKVRFTIEVYSMTENKKLLTKNSTINLPEFESGLEECLGEVISSLSATITDNNREFLTTSIIGTNQKTIESFGNAIAATGNLSPKSASTAVAEFERIANENPKMYLAKYTAAMVCARAEQYDKAIKLQKELISSFGSSNPSLYLDLASFCKASGQFSDALDAIENASKEPSFKLLILAASAGIYEAKGDLQRAKNEYEKVLSEGGDDGEIFFRLALVSIGLNDLSGSTTYLSKASDAGYQLNKNSYVDLGMRYATLRNANDKAVEAYKKSLELQQDNENAWSQLAKLYSSMNQKSDAAECYVNLFQINNTVYKDDLVNAAEIYEGLGDTEKAKDAYSLFLARKFVDPAINVKLAKLELLGGDCEKATDLVYGMDTMSAFSADVHEINQKCGKPERRVVIATDNGPKKSPAKVIWRVASGILTAGSLVGAYYFDSQIAAKNKTYADSKNKQEVDNLHNEIESNKTLRSACYAGAGVFGFSLVLSISLPAIFSKK